MAECAEATVPRSWNITKRLIWFEGSITASKPDFPSRLSAPILVRNYSPNVYLTPASAASLTRARYSAIVLKAIPAMAGLISAASN